MPLVGAWKAYEFICIIYYFYTSRNYNLFSKSALLVYIVKVPTGNKSTVILNEAFTRSRGIGSDAENSSIYESDIENSLI